MVVSSAVVITVKTLDARLNSGILFWHWVVGENEVVFMPVHFGDALEASWATEGSAADEFPEARLVYEVVAGRDLAGLARSVNVLKADGTVLPGDALDAVVVPICHVERQTHVAFITVEVVVLVAHPANSAAVAVELNPTHLVVKQFALEAAVSSKEYSAVFACRSDWLSLIAC